MATKTVTEDVWLSPIKILWGAFRGGYENLVVVGEKDGVVEVYSTLGGRKANSLMTKAIRQVKTT